MARTIQRLKVTMQYHMEAVSEVSNECVQYMGLPLSHVLLTKWRKQLSHELPFYIQNSTQQTFFLFIVISDVNKNLEVGILCFRLQRLSSWSISDRCESK